MGLVGRDRTHRKSNAETHDFFGIRLRVCWIASCASNSRPAATSESPRLSDSRLCCSSLSDRRDACHRWKRSSMAILSKGLNIFEYCAHVFESTVCVRPNQIQFCCPTSSSQFPRGRVGVSLSVTGHRRQFARVPEPVGRSLLEDCPPVSAPAATELYLCGFQTLWEGEAPAEPQGF